MYFIGFKGLGYAIISKKGLFGVRSEMGDEIIPVKFNHIEKVSDGYIVYGNKSKINPLKGWYSRDGKSNIPCLFETIKFQRNEIFVETLKGLKGIYSYNGKEIIPPKFKSIIPIGSFMCCLNEDNKLSMYDLGKNV